MSPDSPSQHHCFLEFYMLIDEFDNITSRSARREHFRNTGLFESRDIAFWDDTATDDQYIVHAILMEKVDDFREQMTMSTRKNAHSNNIDVLLQSSFSNLLRSLAKPRIDDLEASITQRAGNDLSAAIMAVKARFSN